MSNQTKPILISNISPFGLRIQPWLKDKLEQSAQDNATSLNKEISVRLEESYEPKTSHDNAHDLSIALNQFYLQQKECERVTAMYRKAIESQYNLEDYYNKGHWGMDAFIPLGDDRYAFINHKDQVVWAYEGEFDTNQHYFVPSHWNLETGNWEGLDFEHPAIMHDLEVIDAKEFSYLHSEAEQCRGQ